MLYGAPIVKVCGSVSSILQKCTVTVSPLLTVMDEGANKSVGIPNFVSLASGICELNKQNTLFVIDGDGRCAKEENTGHTRDATTATAGNLPFFIFLT